MARYTKAKAKLCRRFGENLFGTEKYAKILARKNYRPGMHGKSFSRNQSEYGKQLLMKQKIKIIYGILERQFRRHYEEIKNKQGISGDLLMARLEKRLDNVVYRAGYAETRPQARQLVTHGAITVNGQKMSIPSSSVRIGDLIGINPTKRKNKYFAAREQFLKSNKSVPAWLAWDSKEFTIKVLAPPQRENWEQTIDPQIVVEYYSK